jgi:hypothetical protein
MKFRLHYHVDPADMQVEFHSTLEEAYAKVANDDHAGYVELEFKDGQLLFTHCRPIPNTPHCDLLESPAEKMPSEW